MNEKELIRATEDILEGRCSKILSYDHEVINEEEVELNDRLVKFVLNNTIREDDGRLRMPIMWRIPGLGRALYWRLRRKRSSRLGWYGEEKRGTRGE